MDKRLLLPFLLLAQISYADVIGAGPGPTIECRFGALTANGHVGLDEVVDYTIDYNSAVSGFFEPYEFEISVYGNDLSVGVYLEGEPISGLQIPVANILELPLGASVFGLATVFHELSDGFVSLQYECLKVLWGNK